MKKLFTSSSTLTLTALKLLALTLAISLSACDKQSELSSDDAQGDAQTDAKTANAEPTVDLEVGQQKYDLLCAGCHNPGDGHAGTMKLKLVKGEENSVILARTDLSAEYIRFVVRDGLLEMAPFRPTDIDDGDLDSLAAYILSRPARAPVAQNQPVAAQPTAQAAE